MGHWDSHPDRAGQSRACNLLHYTPMRMVGAGRFALPTSPVRGEPSTRLTIRAVTPNVRSRILPVRVLPPWGRWQGLGVLIRVVLAAGAAPATSCMSSRRATVVLREDKWSERRASLPRSHAPRACVLTRLHYVPMAMQGGAAPPLGLIDPHPINSRSQLAAIWVCITRVVRVQGLEPRIVTVCRTGAMAARRYAREKRSHHQSRWTHRA